ncbi:MAG: hypothetical protein V1776_03220 [Candidatus Diapherotrites archaeon]
MESKKIILLLSLAGVLFSGWLTYGKLIEGACPLTEGCSYLLGWPICAYGLLMFGILFIVSLMEQFTHTKQNVKIIRYVSIFGVLFSGGYTLNELMNPSCLLPPCTYSLIVPTCIYGLVMYALIAYFSWKRM